jgi:hypothetical protein
MKDKDLSLDKSLQAYRVMHTPSEYSWKQHWVSEKFSHIDYMKCTDDEKQQFGKRLDECKITIIDNVKMTSGRECTLRDLINIIPNVSYSTVKKSDRKVVYSSSNGQRPIGQTAYDIWDGFQVIDMDIKDANIASQLKEKLFQRLTKYNWFLGVVISSSGKGLHIYTKIQIAQSDSQNTKRKLLYITNFRHKYSFIYLACLTIGKELGFGKDELLQWMDLAMFKPQQGAFIPYDPHPLINTNFFEDFIYVSFDNVEDLGHPDVDWVTYPDLKELFKRWEWFEETTEQPKIEVREAGELIVDTHNKVHYKHFERWRLANTLVKLYGLEQGFKYLRMICSNATKDKELQGDCITASRHDKPVDVWAVNRLNLQHGFKIKLNIPQEEFDLQELYNSIDNIENPTLIKESSNTKTYYIKSNEYLGNIKNQLIKDIGRVTLIEAGAGVGKTEMVKAFGREGKRVMMIMPFTSTIKSKVEGDKNWYYSYGNRKVRFDKEPCVSLTLDKFAKLNLMDIKEEGFDYIFLDESHLLFQSEYRPVMPKVIEMIRNSEVPIILMSGTPIGETVFFPDITHLRVIKEDTRKKEFNVRLVDKPDDLMYHMCRNMARDISQGKRVLFPTNKGTLYKEQIQAAVQYFLEKDFCYFDQIVVNYYKKSNIGEDFMNDINFNKTIKKTNILMCSDYLSVGVDILDKYEFSIYFSEIRLPQEVEQFANRLRSNDLFIYMYLSKNDANGDSKNLNIYNQIDLRLNDDEIKNAHAILAICNGMIERNPIEYKYNSLVASIINNNKFIEYNDIENKYYLNEIAYKTIYFERKYRDYAQQLPVLAKGMIAYGYEYSAKDLKSFNASDIEGFDSLKSAIQTAYDDRVKMNTSDIEELIDLITEDRLLIYKGVLSGEYDIKKGKDWKEDQVNKTMVVKNIEMFEKVVPLFVSMSKLYNVVDIKDIFEHCRNKNGSFNFAAIRRIRMLINILYNNKQKRLDIPIQDYMNRIYNFVENNEKVRKQEIDKFIYDFTIEYAKMESKNGVIIEMSPITIQTMVEIFTNIFKCLVECSRPKKGYLTMKKVELLWEEKQDNYSVTVMNEKIFALAEFLQYIDIDKEEV